MKKSVFALHFPNWLYVCSVSLFLSRLAKREDTLLSCGFLANHRLCKHPQNQLVLVYQHFIYNFSNTFPLHLILSSMVWYFQNKCTVREWIYLFIIRKAHGHVLYGLFLESYKASFKYYFEWWINKKIIIHENISCCFLKQISVRDKWNFRVGCIEQVHCGYMLYGSDFLVRRKIEECQELTYILSCIIYIEKMCFSYINSCLK